MLIVYVLFFLYVLTVPIPVGFNYDVWNDALYGYSDYNFVWNGIHDGFDIGWIPNAEPTYVDNPYIPVSEPAQFAITRWLIKRHASGVLLGPFTVDNCPFAELHFSPLFTVLRPDALFRVVQHLSHPRNGVSVNDCIMEEAKEVSYMYFTDIAEFIYLLGIGSYLWVIDAKDAYYRLKIKKKYWKYMAIKWFGLIFIFTSLQMGLGSACAIYQRFADAVLYIIRTKNSTIFYCTTTSIYLIHHYLDDFFGGHKDPLVALQQLKAAYDWFDKLGIPTQLKKLKFPYWKQIILGWQWNTRDQTVSMPQYKVISYTAHVTRLIRERERGTDKKDLERLDGKLGHASVGVSCGRAKLRNLQHALHLELRNYDERIILSDLVISDLKWWLFALKHMNGIPLTWVFKNPKEFDDEIWTDAALRGDELTGGMGGCTKSGYAYQLDNRRTHVRIVSMSRQGVDIKLMETMAMYLILAWMAPKLRYKNVKLFCDNWTTVKSLVKKRGPLNRRDIHFIIDKICMLSIEYRFRFWIEHVLGENNVMADRLSRFKELYKVNNVNPNEFTFIQGEQLISIANDAFDTMLNFKKVPRNTSKDDEY